MKLRCLLAIVFFVLSSDEVLHILGSYRKPAFENGSLGACVLEFSWKVYIGHACIINYQHRQAAPISLYPCRMG